MTFSASTALPVLATPVSTPEPPPFTNTDIYAMIAVLMILSLIFGLANWIKATDDGSLTTIGLYAIAFMGLVYIVSWWMKLAEWNRTAAGLALLGLLSFLPLGAAARANDSRGPTVGSAVLGVFATWMVLGIYGLVLWGQGLL